MPRQGVRRVWSDSRGGLWITRSNSGDLFRYDSTNDSWRRRWHLPGNRPQPYAVYVDDTDAVWVNDWGANAILSFDPKTDRRAPRRRAPRAAWSWLKQTDLIPDKGQLR